jgi:altronate dehydratase
MEFMGYPRPDGSAGARNCIAVIPAVQCDNELADRIASEVGGNVVALPHNGACVNVQPDKDMIERTLIGLGRNPNVSGAIVVGVGCDGIPADRVAEGIAASKKPVELVTIEHEGSYDNALAKGVNAAKRMLSDAARLKREGFDISYLTVGSKCTGCEPRMSMPVPANIIGGMTTLEEKSLGAIAKSGHGKIDGVLEWSERPSGHGLYFMDGSANTPQIFLGFAAGGAQVMTLNYGAGLPTKLHAYTVAVGGLPIVPCLKIFSSPQDIAQMEYFDVYAGTIIEGKETVPEVGRRILEELVAVASGKPARQEMSSRYKEMLVMYYTGPLL